MKSRKKLTAKAKGRVTLANPPILFLFCLLVELADVLKLSLSVLLVVFDLTGLCNRCRK
jgi:hypothetical protein